MKAEKEETRIEKSKNLLSVIRNVLYLTSAKFVILFIIGVMAFLGCSQLFNILEFYTQDKGSVINAFVQGADFDYKTSIPFKYEVKAAADNILKYALIYQDIENFNSSDALQYHIDDETARTDEQIRILKYFASYQIETGEYEKEFLSNGYIKFKKGSKGKNLAWVDEELIERTCIKNRDELIDGYKKSADSNYREITKYLDSMNGVFYAVDDHNGNIITNTGKTSSAQLQSFFSKTKDNLVVFNSKEPYYTTTTMLDFIETVEKLSADYEQNFDIYISFNNGLVFNDNCKAIEQKCVEMFENVSGCLVKATIFTVITLAFSVLLLLIAGKREYKGTIKYSITDKLPNDIHIMFHAITEISMVMLINNSIYIILNPHLGTTWLTVSPTYFIVRAELCCVIVVMVILAALCVIKRHYKNKSLISNTIIYRLLRVFVKCPQSKDEHEQLF